MSCIYIDSLIERAGGLYEKTEEDEESEDLPETLGRPDACEEIHDDAVPEEFSYQRDDDEGENEGDEHRGEFGVGVLLLGGVIGIHEALDGGTYEGLD